MKKSELVEWLSGLKDENLGADRRLMLKMMSDLLRPQPEDVSPMIGRVILIGIGILMGHECALLGAPASMAYSEVMDSIVKGWEKGGHSET